jgi:CCR4-NOT transcription complex subunit 7/8
MSESGLETDREPPGESRAGPSENGVEKNGVKHDKPADKPVDSGFFPDKDGKMVEIKDVWASTLDAEMAVIRELVESYPYVAMDTEFPGVVAKPIGDAYSTGYQYQTLQCNVDLLKIIQLGISFCDGEGKTPEEGCYCFQFNFRFDLAEDMYAEDSIQLLKESGIDFHRHATEGIDVARFGELVMMSGLVLCDDVKWVSFHSGYDFGYLIKILTCQTLPADEQGFFELLALYFPTLYDVKLLMTHVDGLHGGLQRVAEDLKVERIGPMHQAGSDSMLTNATFFRLAELAFSSPEKVEEKYRGAIYGLGEHAYRGKQHQDAAASKYNQDNGGTMNGGHQVQNGVVNMPNDE